MNILKIIILIREIATVSNQIMKILDKNGRYHGRTLVDMTDEELAELLDEKEIRDAEIIFNRE